MDGAQPQEKRDALSAPRIAIVGGGFTGAVLAVHLAQLSGSQLRIDIFESRPQLGAGLAYGACGVEHRINVPSDRMTVFSEDPHHFTRWMRRTGEWDADPEGLTADGDHYARRTAFAAYISAMAAEAAVANPSRSTLRHRPLSVLDVVDRGLSLDVTHNEGTEAYDHAVLCTGHGAPAFRWPVSEAANELAHLLRDPWRQDQIAAIPRDATIFIIGTGLTMADVVVSLRGRGHRGPFHAVSRHALLPRTHAAFDDRFELFGARTPPQTAIGLLRFMRQRIREAEGEGSTWHAVLDALRRNLAAYWPTLPLHERRLIVRFLRSFWDVHRFRMAPQVTALIESGRREGWLRLSAGRVDRIDREGGRFAVQWRQRGAEQRSEAADAIVNCTGPDSDIGRSGLPLIRALAERGCLRPDPLRLGLDVDERGRLLDRSGRSGARLWAAGPLARSVVGEATGVPEASQHARTVARALLDDIAGASLRRRHPGGVA